MSLSISAGSMTITDGGDLRFATDEGLFHTITKLSGNVAVATVTATSSIVDSTTRWDLGACHADCTHIIGAVKFTLNNYGSGMAFDRWHTIMGGSILWLLDGESGVAGSVGLNGTPPYQWCSYDLIIDAAHVYLERRLILNKMPTGGTYSVLSHTIDYNLEVGLFT